MTTKVTVAYGDGIGPEIMEATLYILQKAEADIEIDTIEIGEKLYLKGHTSGISKDAWDRVKQNKIFLKAPITTPQGKGHKSLNVTFRKALGLFANVRPAVSYYPLVESKHKKMDLVVIRENEEDLYAGIEYKFNSGFAVAYKVITKRGSEKIIRYAFEYARQNNRKKVTVLIKDNIMKISDGMFHDIFKTIAKEYPELKAESMIVDIGSARVASRPQDFDVIVTLNLYGDIVSDIAAEVSGSVGLAGSANIGKDFAMFEAVHGSAPDIAGQQIANPSGLLNGAIMMLEYIGQQKVANKIKNAWLKTLEDGIHTKDIFQEGKSTKLASTQEFAESVVANLGQQPSQFAVAQGEGSGRLSIADPELEIIESKLIGADIYIDAKGQDVSKIANILDSLEEDTFKLHLISQRGLKLWPMSESYETVADLIRCRFIGYEDKGLEQKDIITLLAKIDENNLEIANIVRLNMYNDQLAFSMAQGE